MPWVGHVHRGSIRKLLFSALDHGHARSGNRQIRVRGDVHRVWTFTGPWFRSAGEIDCLYYGKTVLSVDFNNQRITDYGWHQYNSCTNQTIRGYEDVILDLFGLALPRKHVQYIFYRWMESPRQNTPYGRFASRVPWVKDGWFLWEHYDPALADAFHEGESDLRQDQNWRWFTYDWDQHGTWARRFISTDAERRFRQKEKRCQRTSKTTKSTSSVSSTWAAPLTLSMQPCASTTPSACPTGMEVTSSPNG